MIDMMAERMALGIKRRAPDHPASIAVLKHSLAILINTTAILALTITIGFWTERLSETLVIMVSFAVLRMVSGGAHLKSGDWCVVVSTILIVGLSLLTISDYIVVALNIVSLGMVLAFAPTDIHKQSRIPQKYYPLLKLISTALIICSFFLASSAVAVGFFAQSILLISRKEVKTT